MLHIESMDIVKYVDDHWPGDKLIPEDAVRRELSDALVARGKALHRNIRYVSFRWGLGRLGRLGRREEARLIELEQDGSPEGMAEFYAGFDADRIPQSIYLDKLRELEAGYAELETLLERDGRAFLTGPTLTPADIIWSLKVLRIAECGYPFASRYPALFAWYGRVARRPGFRAGVMARHGLMSGMFKTKASVEGWFGRGLKHLAGAA